MEFISFLKTLPKQDDKHVNAFLEWALNHKYIPSSSDPSILAKYLYDKLDWDLTHAFQKLFVVYEKTDPDNAIPAQYKGHGNLLHAINIIVILKNDAGHNPEMKPLHKPKATRALEYICLYPVEMPTEKDGNAYAFLAVDGYSKMAFMTGLEKDASDEIVLKHIDLLVKHKDIVDKLEEPFTLVLHKYEHLRTSISSIIHPLSGSMLVDDAYVAKVATPVIENMFKHLADKME